MMIPRIQFPHPVTPRGALRVLAMAAACLLLGCDGKPTSNAVLLTGRAVLPADTFLAGDPVGAALDGEFNGRTPPFPSLPVQGFSSLVHLGGSSWVALQDNGFGSAANSPDYPLQLFRLRVDLDQGTVEVESAARLTDPDGWLGFSPARPFADGGLGGADLDPESLVRLDDGTFWIGEEFGPYLVHVDAQGRVLEAPIAVPVPAPLRDHARGLAVYRSPDHPDLRDLPEDERLAAANLARSGGLEGLTRTPDGRRLFLSVEKPLRDDPVRDRRTILEFDPETRAFTGRHWFYRPDLQDGLITSLEAWSDTVLLVLERDHQQGAEARVKRVYRVDLTETDADGFLPKTLVCDLLDLADPRGLTTAEPGAVGLGPRFTFPFVTPESLAILDARTLVLVDDNNYPFSNGRRPGVPDDSEFIRLELPRPLPDAVR